MHEEKEGMMLGRNIQRKDPAGNTGPEPAGNGDVKPWELPGSNENIFPGGIYCPPFCTGTV